MRDHPEGWRLRTRGKKSDTSSGCPTYEGANAVAAMGGPFLTPATIWRQRFLSLCFVIGDGVSHNPVPLENVVFCFVLFSRLTKATVAGIPHLSPPPGVESLARKEWLRSRETKSLYASVCRGVACHSSARIDFSSLKRHEKASDRSQRNNGVTRASARATAIIDRPKMGPPSTV